MGYNGKEDMVKTTRKKKQSDLVRHAEYELEFAGFNDREDDEAVKISKSVMDLVNILDKSTKNDAEIALVVGLFDRIASALPLTPLSNDPDEWIDVSRDMLKERDVARGRTMHRNKRTISVFSFDKGIHWEDYRTKRKGTSLTKEEIFNGKTQEQKEKEVYEEYIKTHPVAEEVDGKDGQEAEEAGSKDGSKKDVERSKEKSSSKVKQPRATKAIRPKAEPKPKVSKAKSRPKKDV
jgi:hypothetical protein